MFDEQDSPDQLHHTVRLDSDKKLPRAPTFISTSVSATAFSLTGFQALLAVHIETKEDFD